MSKSEVYSWRLTPELKAELEAAAQREKSSLSELLTRITREWLTAHNPALDETEEERLREALMACAGAIELDEGGPFTNQRVREFISAKLEARHKRSKSPH